jgi:choice-of-anchor B domain-containing protein
MPSSQDRLRSFRCRVSGTTSKVLAVAPTVNAVALPLLAAAALLAPALVPAPAFSQVSRNVTLLSHMDNYSTSGYSSCWSYIHSDGREYAFELARTGASVVRLTDPAHPVEVGFFNLYDSEWHEGRQYRNYFYITVEDRSGGRTFKGLTIIDMSDPDHPHTVGNYHSDLFSAHTIEIDIARGYLYAAGATGAVGDTYGQGTFIYSLANPENPVLISVYGNGFPEYIHTIHVDGTRGYASMEQLGVTRILDLTDPAHPATLAEFETPGGRAPGVTQRSRTHSAWNTPDGRYLVVTDEVSGVGLYVYDIQNLANIRQVYSFQGLPPRTIAHDPVVRGNLLFQAYYTAGARVYDMSNPTWPAEVGFYDTFAGNDGGFNGCWEVAPLYPSGIFIASDTKTGLYVFRLTSPYGVVRGTAQQVMTGTILPGVVVTQASTASTVSFTDGRYSIGMQPGSVTLTFSKFGYETLTKKLNVMAGSDQTFDPKLRPLDAGALNVTVTSAGTPLAGAELAIVGTPLRAVSDASGVAVFSSVPVGTWQVRCVRPGQTPQTLSAMIIKATTTSITASLTAALSYDDAEADRGWSLADKFDDAIRGLWTRGVPNGTVFTRTAEAVQTASDHTPGAGSACFLTGNAPVPASAIFSDDVADGQTTLTSPAFHLAGVSDPRLGYWRWYFNYAAEFTPDDPLVTQLSNDGGQTWVSVESLYESPAGWQFVELRVRDYFSTPGDVLLRFIASDRGEFGAVEAAVDDIMSYAGSGAASSSRFAAASAAAPRFGAPRPSPTRDGASIELSLPRPAEVRADLFDVQGRRVRTIQSGVMPEGLNVIRWNGKLSNGERAPAGVYWLRVRSDDLTQSSRLVVVR